MFSKTCEYGIKAMIYISQHSPDKRLISLKEIASNIESPEAFTAKILQLLRKHNLLASVKGNTGGFKLADQQNQIKLSQIVEAIDGDRVFTGCGLGLKECSELQPCPIHHQFKTVRDELKQMLETTTLDELSGGLIRGKTFLKR